MKNKDDEMKKQYLVIFCTINSNQLSQLIFHGGGSGASVERSSICSNFINADTITAIPRGDTCILAGNTVSTASLTSGVLQI